MAPKSEGTAIGVRAIALVGPAGAGKTSLSEALLYASGEIGRQGTIEAGTTIGDASPEARARKGSTEINLVRLDYLGDRFVVVDLPGSAGFMADGLAALESVDFAILVVDPDPARAALAEPMLRRIEAARVPYAIFVNKIDQARGRIHDLLAALQPMSAAPLLARQIPIRNGESITGFVDLALERAYHYRAGHPSEQIDIPEDLMAREVSERFHLMETLADHDDALLEQLLTDQTPSRDMIFADLASETQANLVVPVLFGSALNGFGVRRLLKMLRHEAPLVTQAANRIGANGSGVHVFKISHGGAIGRVALARVLGKGLDEGAELIGPEGEIVRAGALFGLQGEKTVKVSHANAGDIVAIAKADNVRANAILGTKASADASVHLIEFPALNAAVVIETKDRKDDVRLSSALHKLAEEDPALQWGQNDETHEMLLRGVNDEHLSVTIAKLKRRYGVAVETREPRVAYKESIRKSATQRGRHKKQSGGHGQYGDVVIEVRPLARGEGFRFEDRISGGVVPKQWIPAVEAGIRDAMQKGPLGFPVVDVAVTLIDGSYHSVDSSEIAFRMAGRIAMNEALQTCAAYLLEPICHVEITTPSGATSKVTSAVSARRGQMLGIDSADGNGRWDRLDVMLPEASMQGLDAELRSLSQGLARFEARFDHLSEVNGKQAEIVAKQAVPA
jgi:elongation factor G